MSITVHELLLHEPPQPILVSQEEFLETAQHRCPYSNFLKGVKWSPDGASLLTTSDDNLLRVYDLPAEAIDGPGGADRAKSDQGLASSADTLPSVLRVDEGETVYDYAWYPGMLVSQPASCVFACTARGHPIHLWDALSGQLRASYRVYNAADEVTAACSIAFDAQGQRLYAGLNNRLCIFDVARPGRYCKNTVPHTRASPGLQGIIASICCNPDHSAMLAAGSYLGDTGIFDENTGDLLYVLQGQRGGITQVEFSRDGNYLYTGARRDTDIFCWDVRYTSDVVYRLQRDAADTNQRIQFDIEPLGRHLASGGSKGRIQIFDLQEGQEVAGYQAAADTVNGFQFHPFLPLAATASGHRRLAAQLASDSDSEAEGDSSADLMESPAKGSVRAVGTAQHGRENALTIWRFVSELKEFVDSEAAQAGDGDAHIPAQQQSNGRTDDAAGLVPETEGEHMGDAGQLGSDDEMMRASVAVENASEHLPPQEVAAASMDQPA